MSKTYLERRIHPLLLEHPGRSGFLALADGHDAFAARLMLTDLAESTLDIRYYIWEKDITGTLLFESLYRAAGRGVRVRLLLDDNNTGGLDEILAGLNAHPLIEIRLFNPFRHRRWRVVDYLTDLARVNRRMHNKSFTADNAVAIIGGRNIGDEYFNVGPEIFFIDLDALAVGPVVKEVTDDFERYWNSESSHPAEKVLKKRTGFTSGRTISSIVDREPAVRDYLHQLTDSPYARDFPTPDLEFEWIPIRMVSDDPAKGLGRAHSSTFLPRKLRDLLDYPSKELFLLAPYFVPGKWGVEWFSSLRKQGVEVSILTNSFEASDVGIVHAGYIKRRDELLRLGVKLYELKYFPGGQGAAGSQSSEDRIFKGSSTSSLHAKTFSVDGSHVFIGSFNFDPRSALLNTEMGFIVKSPGTAKKMAELFARRIPERSYEVRLNGKGKPVWIEREEAKEIIHNKEPGIGFKERLLLRLLSGLPIEWLL